MCCTGRMGEVKATAIRRTDDKNQRETDQPSVRSKDAGRGQLLTPVPAEMKKR